MKILHLLNAFEFDTKQMDFPVRIAREHNGEISALFIAKTPVDTTKKFRDVDGKKVVLKDNLNETNKIVDENIETYSQYCRANELVVDCRKASHFVFDETIEASKFADLLILSSTLFKDFFSLENILTDANCPVLILPENFVEFRQVVFTYNGSGSSNFAIKQFTLLFPEFKNTNVVVLYVAEKDQEVLSNQSGIRNYLEHYYNNVTIENLKGNPPETINNYLSRHPGSIVTFGAYGRSKISNFFKKSHAEDILKNTEIPVFITHP